MDATELAIFKEFIARQAWIFAKSYATSAPHHYIVREKLSAQEQEVFIAFVVFIRQWGTPHRFFKKRFIYLVIDGFKYWTYGDPLETTFILNRVSLEVSPMQDYY